MESNYTKTIVNSLSKLSTEQIIKLFSVDCEKFISASKSNNTFANILKEIIVESDRKRVGGDGLSRSQWRQNRWGDRVEEVFLEQKKFLDKISFWYWMVPNKSIAMEYYYQLCNQETTFFEIKKIYPDAKQHTNKKLKLLSNNLRLIAQRSTLNVPEKPINNGKNHFLIFLLTDRKSAQLDDTMREKILSELEQQWCDREIIRIIEESHSIPIEPAKNTPQNNTQIIKQ